MTPRKTQHGAKAKTSRASTRSSKTSATSRTRKSPSRAPSRKPKKNARRRPLITAAVVVAGILLFVWAFYPVASVSYRETREARRLSAELQALKSRNERLRTQVDKLRTPAGVEDYARSELGMVKKGEHVAVVVDENSGAEASRAAAAPEIDSDQSVTQPVGPWTALLDLVFGVQ